MAMNSASIDSRSEPWGLAAQRLREHLDRHHWDGHALVGPDPVGKIHWRVTRFIRSYAPWLPGDDRYVYLQGNAYWIRALSLLAESGDEEAKNVVAACADAIVAR